MNEYKKVSGAVWSVELSVPADGDKRRYTANETIHIVCSSVDRAIAIAHQEIPTGTIHHVRKANKPTYYTIDDELIVDNS